MSTSTSVLQKIESWVTKAKLKLESVLATIAGPTLAAQIETAFSGLLATAEGQLALKVVTEAADVTSGQVNVASAVSATITAVEATGKTLTQSAATALVAAAQQKVLSIAQPS
jgi:hypothetical protein